MNKLNQFFHSIYYYSFANIRTFYILPNILGDKINLEGIKREKDEMYEN